LEAEAVWAAAERARLETKIIIEARLKHRRGLFIALLLGDGEFTETGNRAFQRVDGVPGLPARGSRAVEALSCPTV
jgi:hypothetical protein